MYLRKRCRDHGEFEALAYGDAEEYLSSSRFNRPGAISLTFQTEVKDGCPFDCGLCPEHKQHACLGIIEVNTGCNLDCPICFADSGHQPDGYSITHEQCERMLDVFVASEGEAEVVMLSGGEPTIHRHVLDFIDLALQRPIRNVTLNTNGIRLATDKDFVAELGKRNRVPGRSVNVYLQFDGFEQRTHLEIRGRDLRTFKQRALDNCADAGLTVTLVAAVERGLNEHELGAIIGYGIDHPAVRSVAFQPVTHSGRHVAFDPLRRLTNPDVIRLINEQRPDWFQKGDFFPVPCCFPTCRSVTYLLVGGEPGDRTVVPRPATAERRGPPRLRHQPGHARRRDPRGTGATLVRVRMHGHGHDRGEATDRGRGPGLRGGLWDRPARGGQQLDDKAFMVVVQDFQDPYTLNVKQLMKCCVEEIPRRAAHPLLCLQLRRIPRTGPRRDVRRPRPRRLADRLALAPDMRVLDVASGRGTTALLLADAYRVRADGIDLSPTNTARIACIADAPPLRAYVELLTAAGLRPLVTERHDKALLRMIDQIQARLGLLRITAPARLAEAGVDLDAAPAVLDAARAAVTEGVLGYTLLTAVKGPGRPCDPPPGP